MEKSVSRGELRLVFVDKDEGIAPGTYYGPVIYDNYIVECCVDGGGTIVINGAEFPVTVGQGYVLAPGDNVSLISDPVTSRTCLFCAIDGDKVDEVLDRAGINAASPYIPPSAFPEVQECISELLEMENDVDGGADLRRTAAVYRMLSALLREHTSVDKNIWVNRAIAIMETKYPEEITVADLARAVGLDRAYFSTLFKSVTGTSPYSYLTALRVRKACTLLQNTGLPVSAVAEAVGIDPQNFARIFRRITGITPSEYDRHTRP